MSSSLKCDQSFLVKVGPLTTAFPIDEDHGRKESVSLIKVYYFNNNKNQLTTCLEKGMIISLAYLPSGTKKVCLIYIFKYESD